MSDVPAWAKDLMQRLDVQQQQLVQLQHQLALCPATSMLPTYPQNVSSEALTALAADPRFPDHLRVYLRLLTVALPGLITDDQLDASQAAYTELCLATSQHSTPPSIPASPSTTQPATRFFQQYGRPFYRSKSGKVYDTTRPPPYPCRRCGGWHWAWASCPGFSKSGSHSQNSYMGEANPAYPPPSSQQ